MPDFKNLLHNSKHFCILPWIHFHAWPDGRVMPCCVADSNKPVAKIDNNESILEMMNSEEYKKIRLAMLKDEPVEACRRCYDLELMGTWTMRQSHNTVRGLDNISSIAATRPDGSITRFKMKYMDIRFSNICNMKCRSCGPSCSSLWAQEYKDRYGEARLKDRFNIEKIVITNNEENDFFEKLRPYLKDVEEVYFAGGEALITKEHYDCLDFWIENNLTEKVELTYTTNFSSLRYKDKDLVGYWKKFPKLKVWASLDGKELIAEFLRKGTDWERIEENIKYFKESVPHAEFQITPTISIWNVFSFPEFFDYMIEEGLIDTNSAPRFNLATFPWYANVQILPNFAKEELKAKYDEYVEKYKEYPEIANGFKMINHAINTGEESKAGIKEFIKFNSELDDVRKEKTLWVIPELRKIYKWAES